MKDHPSPTGEWEVEEKARERGREIRDVDGRWVWWPVRKGTRKEERKVAEPGEEGRSRSWSVRLGGEGVGQGMGRRGGRQGVRKTFGRGRERRASRRVVKGCFAAAEITESAPARRVGSKGKTYREQSQSATKIEAERGRRRRKKRRIRKRSSASPLTRGQCAARRRVERHFHRQRKKAREPRRRWEQERAQHDLGPSKKISLPRSTVLVRPGPPLGPGPPSAVMISSGTPVATQHGHVVCRKGG